MCRSQWIKTNKKTVRRCNTKHPFTVTAEIETPSYHLLFENVWAPNESDAIERAKSMCIDLQLVEKGTWQAQPEVEVSIRDGAIVIFPPAEGL